jgi:hypothetical protein
MAGNKRGSAAEDAHRCGPDAPTARACA